VFENAGCGVIVPTLEDRFVDNLEQLLSRLGVENQFLPGLSLRGVSFRRISTANLIVSVGAWAGGHIFDHIPGRPFQ